MKLSSCHYFFLNVYRYLGTPSEHFYKYLYGIKFKFKPRTVKTLYATAVSIPVFRWIRNPDPVRLVDLDPDSESGTSSGSRRTIMIHKSIIFLEISCFEVKDVLF